MDLFKDTPYIILNHLVLLNRKAHVTKLYNLTWKNNLQAPKPTNTENKYGNNIEISNANSCCNLAEWSCKISMAWLAIYYLYIYKFEDRSGTGLDKLAIKKIKDAH